MKISFCQPIQIGFRVLMMLALASSLFGQISNQHCAAQEFRIDSQIYVDSSKLPVSQNVTLFSQQLVYDFQMSDQAQPKPVETVIFDTRRRMMVLLDIKRKIRLEIPELRLITILESVRKNTLEEPRSSFLVNDSFKENNDWSTGWVTLESPSITYRYKGSHPKNAEILPLYFDFLDNFTRLHATDPTKIPPFARLKLNSSIRRVGWMPTEVKVTVKPNSLFQKGLEARSTHALVNQLSKLDHQRIAEAKQQWLNFKAVDLSEYRNLTDKPLPDLTKVDELAEKLKNRTGNFDSKGKVIKASHTQ